MRRPSQAAVGRTGPAGNRDTGDVGASWGARVSIVATGLGALVLVAFIVIAIPWLLVRFVGNPLPTTVPDLDALTWSLRNGQIANRFWIGSLAIVVWVVWAQLTFALVLEIAAVLRSVEAPRLPVFGFAGTVATQLVGAIVLLSVVATLLPTEVSALSSAPLSSGPPRAPMPTTTAITEPVIAEAAAPALRVGVDRRTTLRSLASEHLGDVERWSEIRDHNVGSAMADGTVLQPGFTRLSAGWTLEIPGVADVVGTWTVREGDHFWRIAHETLEAAYGRAPTSDETSRYWREIVELNDQRVKSGDPDLIYPGERFEVTLPPIPNEGLASGAPLVSEDFSMRGLLPENVFEPATPDRIEGPEVHGAGSTAGDAESAGLIAPTEPEHESERESGRVDSREPSTPAAQPVAVGSFGTVPQLETAEAQVLPADRSAIVPSADQPAVDQRTVDQTAVDQASVDQPTVDQASVDQRTVADPAGGEAGPSTRSGGVGAARLVAGASGLGFLAYGLARALRRRRELQWARRVEGHIPAPASLAATQMMTDVEATSAGTRVTELDRFLRSLFADVAPAAATHISHIGIDDDKIVLHSTASLSGLGPCTPDDTKTQWSIARSQAAVLGTPGVVESDAMPMLVGAGIDPSSGADLLLNLGHALGVDLFGPHPARRAFIETLATELATSVFADELQVVCCGFGSEVEALQRARRVDSVREAIAEIRSDPFRAADVRSGDAAAPRSVVLVAEDVPPDEIDELVQLTLAGVVVVAPGIESRWSVALSPGSMTIAPIDRTVRRRDLTAEQFAAVGELIATSALSEYVPPTPALPPAASAGLAADGHVLAAAITGAVPSAPIILDRDSAGLLPGAVGSGSAGKGGFEAVKPAVLTAGAANGVDPIDGAENGDVPIDDAAIVGVAEGRNGTTASRTDGLVDDVDAVELLPTAVPPTAAPPTSIRPIDPPIGVALDCDIEVRVLGRVEVIGADRDFESARALDVITYLAFHRDGADSDQLRTWLWPADEPPTDKAFANVLSRARKGLGVDDEGSPYLSRAGRDGVYRLSKAVATDFDRFMAHVEQARTLDGEAALKQQVEALELVRGVPFTGGGATGFIWTDLGTRSHVDFTVDETAHACADAALAVGQPAVARWAAAKGLSIIPGCEQCYRRRLLAAAADRNKSELVAAMGELQRHLAVDAGEPEAYDVVSPDLVDLYEDLLNSLGGRSAASRPGLIAHAPPS